MPPVKPRPLSSYWQTTDGETVRLYLGNVTDVLARMPEKSVQCVVTSPPYWGLRDYKTGSEYELGNEPTPQEFVGRMVEVFREVYRVLRDDGTLWLNIGDCVGPKNDYRILGLVGQPWMLALALKDDGWTIRQDLIWWKPDPMPAPVYGPCRLAHEYLFVFSKSKKWFYDADAIREEGSTDPVEIRNRVANISSYEKERGADAGSGTLSAGRVLGYEFKGEPYGSGTRNKPSVWKIAKSGYPGKHYATFPVELVRPCVLAGTSEKGACAECYAPYRRLVDKTQLERDRPNELTKRVGEEGTGNYCPNTVAGVRIKTIGWEPTCECGDVGVVPCTVLDPFIGSGTSCDVSIELGRHSVGIDLSEKYLRENAIPRITGALLRRRTTAGLAGDRDVTAVDGGTSLMTG